MAVCLAVCLVSHHAAAGVALTGYITKFRNKMKHNMDCNPKLEP